MIKSEAPDSMIKGAKPTVGVVFGPMIMNSAPTISPARAGVAAAWILRLLGPRNSEVK